MKPRAICWASGLIEFLDDGQRLPKGAIVICGGNSVEELREKVDTLARHGYDGSLLVPGVPEADTPDAALDALVKWMGWAFPKAAVAA